MPSESKVLIEFTRARASGQRDNAAISQQNVYSDRLESINSDGAAITLMKLRNLNWQLWAGLLLSIFAFISYPLIFVNWPATRDVPWVNLLLFVAAVVLLAVGVVRSFGPQQGWLSKLAGLTAGGLGVLIFGLFIFSFVVMPTWLPESKSAPEIGRKAPEFTLPDHNGTSVTLDQLLREPIAGAPPKRVVLIFYRGYW